MSVKSLWDHADQPQTCGPCSRNASCRYATSLPREPDTGLIREAPWPSSLDPLQTFFEAVTDPQCLMGATFLCCLGLDQIKGLDKTFYMQWFHREEVRHMTDGASVSILGLREGPAR